MSFNEDSTSESNIAPQREHRFRPNILITGTPGTGKTITAELLSLSAGYTHINIGQFAKENNLYDGYNKEFDSHYINEDAIIDALEHIVSKGGIILDHHTCDFFPERWIDLVIVLRTDNSILYPRLQARSYTEAKVRENVECEIMQVVLEEAFECYKEEIVKELVSESIEQMESNVEMIQEWVDVLEEQFANQNTS